jgi:hypothetical protein
MIELRKCPSFKVRHYGDAVFFGEMKKGEREGKGVMKYQSGRIYEGDWHKNIREGLGFESYSNGNVYNGSYI